MIGGAAETALLAIASHSHLGIVWGFIFDKAACEKCIPPAPARIRPSEGLPIRLPAMNSPKQTPTSSRPDFELEPLAGSLLPKVIKFTDLARCGEEVWIENQGQLYRLRRTRQGKLILTK